MAPNSATLLSSILLKVNPLIGGGIDPVTFGGIDHDPMLRSQRDMKRQAYKPREINKHAGKQTDTEQY